MKIAVVRGDFLSGWEMPIFEPWLKRHEVTLFLGKKLVGNKFEIPKGFKVERLFSPVDLNFGQVRRLLMAILNRLFIDAHVLFGLEEGLKGYDVVYIAETFYKFCWQAVQAKKKGYVKAVVAHIGENILFNNEGIWGRKKLKQEVIAGVDKFICITNRAKKVLIKEGADPKKIIRLTQGIDLERFRKSHEAHETNGINGKIRLLTVSRLVPEKGIKEMVEITTRLRQDYGGKVEFIVVGNGPEERWLNKKWITHIPKVPHEKMPTIYNGADIYLHFPVGSKTWLEQWGFVIAESMACGLPVVALDRGSVREVVGKGGMVVKNEKEFSGRIRELIGDIRERKKWSKIAAEFAKKNYDVKKYSKEVEEVLAECQK